MKTIKICTGVGLNQLFPEYSTVEIDTTVSSTDFAHEYMIVYTNPLTISQMTEVTGRMINKFHMDCAPSSISASPNSPNVRLKFYSTCMTGDALQDIGNRTLERMAPTNTVRTILLDGSQIWPVNSQSDRDAAKDQLINLLKNQITDLVIMSKIELGDDVMTEIENLENIIKNV